MDIRNHVESLFKKIERINQQMFSTLTSQIAREGQIKDAIAVEMRAMLGEWSAELNEDDPKMQEMRLECLKLAAENGLVLNDQSGRYDARAVASFADELLKYVTTGELPGPAGSIEPIKEPVKPK